MGLREGLITPMNSVLAMRETASVEYTITSIFDSMQNILADSFHRRHIAFNDQALKVRCAQD